MVWEENCSGQITCIAPQLRGAPCDISATPMWRFLIADSIYRAPGRRIASALVHVGGRLDRQLDFEKTAKPRPVLLAGHPPTVGDSVRIGFTGAGIEATSRPSARCCT